MRIDKLHLQDFGQFHNKDITLAPGINILYGPNEAGKSTIKDFIVDMLFGIDKSRGIGARFDHYEKRKPINGSAYSGAMEITTKEGQYQIQRNFSRQEKDTTVRDLNTGRQVDLIEPNNLMGTVLKTEKSTYMNTLCIGQMGAATDKEIADRLNHYIVNMASSKTGEIDAVSAVTELKNKKKEFSNKELELRQQELTKSLDLERDFDAELAGIQEQYKKLEAAADGEENKSIQFTPIKNRVDTDEKRMEEKPKEEDEKEPLTKRERDIKMLSNMGNKSILDNVFVTLFVALLGVAAFVGIAYVIPGNVPQVKLAVMGTGIAFVMLTTILYFVRRAQLYKLLEEIEIEKGFEEAKTKTAGADQRAILNQMSDLKVKEQQIVNERTEQENVMKELNKVREEIASNEVETAALNLAIQTIQDLSEAIYDSFGSVLNEQVSKIISKITQNKYSEVKIDDQLRVMVKNGSSYISMDYLSAGTVEQIYLALRLSIANVLVEEELPIIIDDIFVNYDYQRLKETLSCLHEYMNRQIIIFTANPGIQDMFTGLGITSNYLSI
ncbi:MAG: AAA family ATPase [Lachnospiraceae bacterium]|nr:AAA family ATPase [Lachnospiraceae bacterium]